MRQPGMRYARHSTVPVVRSACPAFTSTTFAILGRLLLPQPVQPSRT
jgi:hypothetical protein